MSNLDQKITITPEKHFPLPGPFKTRDATIAKLSVAATLAKGLLLAADADGKLVAVGTTVTTGEGENATTVTYSDVVAVLFDATDVGTTEDVVAKVYYAGTFDTATVSGATITEALIWQAAGQGIYLEEVVR